MRSQDIAVVAVFGIAAMLAVANLLRPVFRAWASRLEGSAADAGLSAQVAELEQRVAELEISGARVGELEERLDFAERLLSAQSPQRQQIERGNA